MKKILVISGFSGVGKGTVVEKLMTLDPDIRLSISETDRERRNLMDRYHFVTPDDFQRNLKDGKYIEFNKYGNHHYATPRQPVLEALIDGEGHPMILEIDVNGMRQVCQDIDLKRIGTEIISVLLVVDAVTLEKRLRNRGDTENEISKRLKIALAESQHIKEYDYVLVNQEVEDTAKKLLAILQGNRIDDKFDSEQFCEEMGKLLEKRGA